MCGCSYCGSKDLETAILKSALGGPPKMRCTWCFDEPTSSKSTSWGAQLKGRNGGSAEYGAIPTYEALGLADRYWDYGFKNNPIDPDQEWSAVTYSKFRDQGRGVRK